MLRRSTLHYLATHDNLITLALSVDGQTPYLIGDLGYPLLPWLMVPHRVGRQLFVSEVLYNKKLRSGRCLVENAFGILKYCFWELADKSDLHLAFLLDVILCCTILHNIFLGQSPQEVEHLLSILRSEDLDAESREQAPIPLQVHLSATDDSGNDVAQCKRQQLGV